MIRINSLELFYFIFLKIYERITIEKLTSSSSSGILFLQLTVEDMGICVPLNPLPPVSIVFLRNNNCCFQNSHHLQFD